MLLQHDDLEQLSTYTRELNRLLFRCFFGCGVVCGLCVETKVNCDKVIVTVHAGLALDCTGDPIYLPKDQSLSFDEECDDSPLWVVLCGKTKCCSPRASMCSADDDEAKSVCTRERDAFEICIVSGDRPKCACAAAPADADPGACGCGCEDSDGCDCCGNCVLLARLTKRGDGEKATWTPDHAVRRFVRPVLVQDPGCQKEEAATSQRIDQIAKQTEQLKREKKRGRSISSEKSPARK